MDAFERLKGLRTCLKMCFNVLERLETKGTDWEVGVRCQTAEKARWIHHKLSVLLSELGEDFGFEISLDDMLVKVQKQATKLQVLALDKEEPVSSKAPLEPLPESPQSDNSSSGKAEDKDFKQIDDVISAFQAHFS